MKFALLKLQHNANLVVDEIDGVNKQEAIAHFQQVFKTTDGQTLDNEGYLKVNEQVTFTIAEYFRS